MISLSDISAVNLIVGWYLLACSIHFLYAYVPQREHVIDISLPHEWFLSAVTQDFCLNGSHE